MAMVVSSASSPLTAAPFKPSTTPIHHQCKISSTFFLSTQFNNRLPLRESRPGSRELKRIISAAATASSSSTDSQEEVYFDGGPHYGDLLANLIFGFTLFWLPLTLAAVFRALFLRYRFTSYRVTILSGLTGGDRKDFKYDVIKDVKFVPRFIGEWGDLVITLKDDSKVELKSLPCFREIAKLCMEKSGLDPSSSALVEGEKGKRKKGFS